MSSPSRLVLVSAMPWRGREKNRSQITGMSSSRLCQKTKMHGSSERCSRTSAGFSTRMRSVNTSRRRIHEPTRAIHTSRRPAVAVGEADVAEGSTSALNGGTSPRATGCVFRDRRRATRPRRGPPHRGETWPARWRPRLPRPPPPSPIDKPKTRAIPPSASLRNGERQGEPFDGAVLVAGSVAADAEHGGATAQFGPNVADGAGLRGVAGEVVSRVKGKRHAPATQAFQAYALAFRRIIATDRHGGKMRRGIADEQFSGHGWGKTTCQEEWWSSGEAERHCPGLECGGLTPLFFGRAVLRLGGKAASSRRTPNRDNADTPQGLTTPRPRWDNAARLPGCLPAANVPR